METGKLPYKQHLRWGQWGGAISGVTPQCRKQLSHITRHKEASTSTKGSELSHADPSLPHSCCACVHSALQGPKIHFLTHILLLLEGKHLTFQFLHLITISYVLEPSRSQLHSAPWKNWPTRLSTRAVKCIVPHLLVLLCSMYPGGKHQNLALPTYFHPTKCVLNNQWVDGSVCG